MRTNELMGAICSNNSDTLVHINRLPLSYILHIYFDRLYLVDRRSKNMSEESSSSSSSAVADPKAVARDIFSATIGSVCCCYVGQPFDTVKVRMQTSPAQFPGVLSSTTSILRNEGITAFWKGAVPTAMGMALGKRLLCRN